MTFNSKLEIACQHVQFPKKRHSKAFVCLLFFILSKRLRQCKQPMHLCYFYSLRGIILWLRKKLCENGFGNTLKIPQKNIQGMIKTTYFYFSILQLFKSAIFFSLLQLFTASEHLKVARDSTSNWRILMTLQCCRCPLRESKLWFTDITF